MRVLKGLAGVLLLFVGIQAHSYVVTIDPDEYGAGADLSHVAPGATLSWFTNAGGNGARFDPVVAVTQRWFDSTKPTGSLIFAGAGSDYVRGSYDSHNYVDAWRCASSGDCNGDPFGVFRVDFASPTNYVEVWAGFHQDDMLDAVSLLAFDADGNILTGCNGAGGYYQSWQNPNYVGPCSKILEIGECDYDRTRCDSFWSIRVERDLADISYVMYGGPNPSYTPNTVDHLSYRVVPSAGVPAPGPLGLFGFGLAALALRRRLAA